MFSIRICSVLKITSGFVGDNHKIKIIEKKYKIGGSTNENN